MKKNIKILLLLLVCIMIFTLTGCQKDDVEVENIQLEKTENEDKNQEVNSDNLINENLEDENSNEIIDEKLDNEDTNEIINEKLDNEDTNEIINEKQENVTIKVLNKEKINSLKSAKMPDYNQSKKMEFFTLKPSEEKVVKLNGKEITLNMYISKYSLNRGEGSLVNYFSYSYYVEMIDYNVTEGSSINGRYYDYVGWFRGQAINNGISDYDTDITKINIEQAINDIGIKIGVLKDVVNGKDYLVCYVEEESFCTNVFYIYDDEGNLVYKGNYDWYFGNIIPVDNIDKYKHIDAIEFYENQIICYDMYMNFENGEKINIEKEIVDVEDNTTNKVHKITIENDIVNDKIVKIYEGVIIGQT